MSKHGTNIEWTHIPGNKGDTWNPIRARNKESGGIGHFCVHVDNGCKNCYAERLQVRFKNPVRYAAQDTRKVDIFLDEKTLMKPLRWAAPRTIFVCSMTDLFAHFVNVRWLDRIFAVMALCPQHTFIVLTKRPERMRDHVRSLDNGDGLPAGDFWSICAELSTRDPLECWPLPNVWLGTSVSDQASADKRVPELLATPAAVRFVSYEPALGPVDFGQWIEYADPRMHFTWLDHLDQIIAGGESGPRARPAHPDWFRLTRDQCAASGVSFFFKQWGEFTPGVNIERQSGTVVTATWFNGEWLFGRENLANDESHRDDEPDLYRVGKKDAGAQLDGVEHREFPKVKVDA